MTLDTSHVFVTDPQNQEWFDEVYPLIKNVHLSSFKDNRDHLPLDMGNFDTIGFITELKKRQYKGLITLEICYPKKISLRDFDFEAIKRSIDLIHNT